MRSRLVLTVGALADASSQLHRGLDVAAILASVLLTGSVAFRRENPVLSTVAAVSGFAAFVRITGYDGDGAFQVAAIALNWRLGVQGDGDLGDHRRRAVRARPELDGISATRRILAESRAPKPHVLILTTFDLDEYVYEALRAGVSGFLLKDVPAHHLATGVRNVADGDALLAPSITRRLIEEFAASRRDGADRTPAPGFDQLTPRELEVFQLVASGMSNAEIAAALVVGETTIKTHVTRILMKLGVRDRVQAVVLAYESGIVHPGSPRRT